MVKFFKIDQLTKFANQTDTSTILDSLVKYFENIHFNIDVTFLDQKSIKALNKKYRGVNSATDVLSFEPTIDIKDPKADVFVCVDYISAERGLQNKELLMEVARMIIHGILHVMGMDHNKPFDENDYDDEKMYLEQECILNVVLSNIKY